MPVRISCPLPANRYSIFMVFAISASIAQIGITARPALLTLASSILAIDLYQSMSLLMTSLPCQVHLSARLVTTVSIVMGHSALRAVVLNHTSRVTDISVLFATTPTFVPVVRPIHRTHITRHILLSNSKPLFATSQSQLWEIMRMVDLCQ